MKDKSTFNGADTSNTVTYPNVTHPVYDEPCPHCHGVGHTHCPDCKKETSCPSCGGSGKKNIYQGGVYKIWWNVPQIETTC